MASLDLPHLYSGKVRDIYDAGDDRLLMVTSDRMSAFDVVMDETIPDKGRVLTAMSAFWFDRLSDVVDNHLISTDLAELPVAGRPVDRRRFMRPKLYFCRRGSSGSTSPGRLEEYNARDHARPPLPPDCSNRNSCRAVFTPSTKSAVVPRLTPRLRRAAPGGQCRGGAAP